MGRIVLITGASRGLGLSLAERFVNRGDTVYGLTRTQRSWQAARKKIQNPERFLLCQVDVSSEPKIRTFIQKIRRTPGRVDILINNAGYGGSRSRLEKERLSEFQKHLSQNLLSAFLMCKHTLPFLLKQKSGWIVNIASMAGKRSVPLLAAYSASKFGVVALGQVIAKENPDGGFKCVTVCPGGIHTEMRAKLFGLEDSRRQQSANFVADRILDLVDGKIEIESGGDIVIRHGQVTAINPPPAA